jgi:hypothetical protein
MDLDDLVGSVTELPARKTQRRPKPRHVPDDDSRRDVVAWTAGGTPQAAMARLLRIDENTLRRHYRAELDGGKDMASAQVKSSLFYNAVVERNVTAQIYWTKTQCGWREKSPYDADNPLVVVNKGEAPVDPKELARKLRDALLEMARPRLVA